MPGRTGGNGFKKNCMEDDMNLQFLSDFIIASCVIYAAVRLFVFVCDAVQQAEKVVKDSMQHQPFDVEDDEEDEAFWFEQQFEKIVENNPDLKRDGQRLIEQYDLQRYFESGISDD